MNDLAPPPPALVATPPAQATYDDNDPHDAFRRLTVRETLTRVGALYVDSSHARLFLSLAGPLFVVPCTLLAMVVVNYVSHGLVVTPPDTHDDDTTHPAISYLVRNWLAIGRLLFIVKPPPSPQHVRDLCCGTVFSLTYTHMPCYCECTVLIGTTRLFLHQCAALLSEAALCHTVAQLLVGQQQPRWTRSFHAAFRQLPHLFLAGLALFAGIWLGSLLALVVGGLFVLVVGSLTTPVIVLEQQCGRQDNGGEATSVTAWRGIQRSYQLTTGARWYVFQCLASLTILEVLLSQMINMVLLGTVAPFLGLYSSVWGTLLSAVPAMIFVPARALLKTIMYTSLRGARDGGWGAAQLAHAMGHVASLLSVAETLEYQPVASDEGPVEAPDNAPHNGGYAL
jgi:hypothetical protein